MPIKHTLTRTLALCWVAYAAIYFGRVNLSVALPELGRILDMSKAQVGLIGSVFFWIYGIGQMINGHIGDKVSVRHYIFIGLIGTAVANLLFGFTTTFWLMLALWGVNGMAQSMLWGPMIRLVGDWTPTGKLTKAVTAVSTSMVGGFLLAWGFSGQLMERASVAWVFWVPAMFLALVGAVWFVFIRNKPVHALHRDAGVVARVAEPVIPRSIRQLMVPTGLPIVILACVAQGIVKDGITLWAPSFFMETHHLDIAHATMFLLLIPLANFGGILLAGWINMLLGQREKLTSAILFGGGAIFLVGLVTLGGISPLLSAIFLALTSAMMFGANTMLLGMVPLGFARYGKVSAVAGLLDFSAYLASGSAAFLTGLLVDAFGWPGVFAFWTGAMIASVIALVVQDWRFAAGPEPTIAITGGKEEPAS